MISEDYEIFILKKLNKFKNFFYGRYMSESESVFLSKKLSPKKLDRFLVKLMLNFPIIGQEFYLSEKKDNSGLGVRMGWMTPTQIVESTFNFSPGNVAHKYDYIPVGLCLTGSGDDYFINYAEKNLPIVRIPHDENFDEDVLDIVSSTLLDFFKKSICYEKS